MSGPRPETLGALVLRGAATWPDREALVFGAERTTYAELLDGSLAAAGRLASLGVAAGDKVGLLLWNGPEFLFTLFGAQLLGAVAVPVNSRFRRDEIAHAVARAEVSVLVTGAVDGDPIDYAVRTAEALPQLADGPASLATVAPHLRAVVSIGREPLPGMIAAEGLDATPPAEIAAGASLGDPDDAALILFTSGTTAWPKGCVLTHSGVLHVWRAVGERFEFRHEDRIFDPLPFFHLGALGPTLAALDLGATVLGMRHFEGGPALELIERERATWLYTMFPPVTMGLVEDPSFGDRDLSALRALANVAPADVLATISAAFAPIPQLQGQFGMTEGSGSMTANRLDDTPEGRLATGGLPLPQTEIKVVDPESGAIQAAGERGELVFRGPGVFLGYYGDPVATAEVLGPEGWLHSGDLGTIDEHGRVQFVGRRKEMLKVGGENVAPAEIESRIASLPGVKLVQVVPAPDPRLDEVPAAFVELLPGYEISAEEVIAHCQGAIAGFKVPRHVRFVTEWPMSATKVQKTKLRDRIAAELGADVGYFCGIDIGGTFTDCVVADAAGNLVVAKVSSTPPDFADGFLAGLAEAARLLGIDFEQLLAETELILHGTTVGTNALVQMNGARTGLITTSGHGDALTMMRSAGRSAGLPIDRLLHVSRHRKPEPIVPPRRIKEVTQRHDWAGREIVPLNEDHVRRAVEELLADDVEAIAISYLWGFVDPTHEQRTREIVEALAPDVFVCCAHEILAKPGEYERTAGTAINAFIGPSTSSYIERLDDALRAAGTSAPLLIMQAAGGVVPAEEAAAKPLFTISSGPVGGVSATVDLAARLGDRNVVACDMGGTSFDVGLVADGEPIFSDQTVTNQYTFFMPRLDIESIGSGGGSIVWVDERSGSLRVGPRSAGARPGPVSYGRGGEEPTITDCNVLLGRLDTENFLGGKVTPDLPATERALGEVAARLGMSAVELADGALRIVESQMADLMRQMTIERGLDPRDFAIYAFGGACGAHAAGFAREYGAGEVVVPLGDLASTWSALGVMSSDVIHVFERADLMTAPFDHARINERVAELEAEATAQLRREGFAEADIELGRFAKMKFSLQIHQLDVPLPAGRLDAAAAERQVDRFLARYEETFGEGAAFVEAGAQIGLIRVIARGRVGSPPVPEARPEPAPGPRSRRTFWREPGGFEHTPVHAGAALGAGTEIAGPALVDYPDTTVAIPPGDTATVDAVGNLRIAIGDRKEGR